MVLVGVSLTSCSSKCMIWFLGITTHAVIVYWGLMNVTENGSFLLHFFLNAPDVQSSVVHRCYLRTKPHTVPRFSELHRLETIRLGLFEKER